MQQGNNTETQRLTTSRNPFCNVAQSESFIFRLSSQKPSDFGIYPAKDVPEINYRTKDSNQTPSSASSGGNNTSSQSSYVSSYTSKDLIYPTNSSYQTKIVIDNENDKKNNQSKTDKNADKNADTPDPQFNIRSMINKKPILYPFLTTAAQEKNKKIPYHPQGFIKSPEIISNKQPEKISIKSPETISVKQSEQIPVKVPEQIPVKVPEQIPVKVPEQIPVKVPEQIPVKVPEQISVKVPEQISVKVPEQIPVKVPETIFIKSPETIVIKQSEQVPIKPEKMTSHFSGTPYRAESPEQIPVKSPETNSKIEPILLTSIKSEKLSSASQEIPKKSDVQETIKKRKREEIPLPTKSCTCNVQTIPNDDKINVIKQNDIKKNTIIILRMDKNSQSESKNEQNTSKSKSNAKSNKKSDAKSDVKIDIKSDIKIDAIPDTKIIQPVELVNDLPVDVNISIIDETSPAEQANKFSEADYNTATASPISTSTGIKQSVQPIDNITLTVDDINTSLKVVGDLKTGYKLKIVNDKYLAVDDSYMSSVMRYNAGQGRNKIIGFLDNIFSEVTRNVSVILSEIRSGVNVDNNICILQGLICKIAVFLHNYETMRSVYKQDSSAYAQLGLNRDKFFMFLNTFFRDVTVKANK